MSKAAFVAACVVYLILSPVARAADADGAQESQIKQRTEEFVGDWARHDGKALAAFFTETGDLISPQGQLARGRPQIEQFFTSFFAGVGKDSNQSLTVTHVDFLKPDVAVVNWEGTISGLRRPDGGEIPECKPHVTLVMVQQDGKWMIAAARPVYYPQNAAGGGSEESAGKAP